MFLHLICKSLEFEKIVNYFLSRVPLRFQRSIFLQEYQCFFVFFCPDYEFSTTKGSVDFGYFKWIYWWPSFARWISPISPGYIWINKTFQLLLLSSFNWFQYWCQHWQPCKLRRHWWRSWNPPCSWRSGSSGMFPPDDNDDQDSFDKHCWYGDYWRSLSTSLPDPFCRGFRYFRYSCKKWQLTYPGNLDKETVDHLKKLLLHFGLIFGI